MEPSPPRKIRKKIKFFSPLRPHPDTFCRIHCRMVDTKPTTIRGERKWKKPKSAGCRISTCLSRYHETRNFIETAARGFDICPARRYIGCEIGHFTARRRCATNNQERKHIPTQKLSGSISHNFGAPLQTTTLPNPASTDSAELLCRVICMVHFCRRIVCGCCGRHVVEYEDRDAPFYIPEIRNNNGYIGREHRHNNIKPEI